MGLKCSVLGHAYGETTVERDREERGSEVVITIRELETCDRCGDTRVVTENKEVTTIEAPGGPDVTAADAVAAMDGEESDAGSATDDAPPSSTGSAPSTDEVAAGADDGEVIDDAEGGVAGSADQSDDATVTGDPSPDEVGADSAGSSTPDAVEDQGAEILDAEDSADEDDAVDDELADPTIENDTDVPGDSAEDEDAVILEDDPADPSTAGDEPGDTAEVEPTDDDPTDGAEDAFGGGTAADEPGPFDPPSDDDADENPLGEWPEETLRDDDDGWTPSEDLTGTVGDVDPDANVDREISTNSAVTVPEGEFHCDECGYTTSVEASSLRAGDFCPECRTGTLVHRPDE